MNYALIEYLAEKEHRPHWAPGASATARTETAGELAERIAERILTWWLRRSTWRLVRLRT